MEWALGYVMVRTRLRNPQEQIFVLIQFRGNSGPCTACLGLKVVLDRYFGAKVYATWVHGLPRVAIGFYRAPKSSVGPRSP